MTGRPAFHLVLPLRSWLALSHLVVLLLPLLAVLGTGALAWDLRRQTAADIDHQAVIVAEILQGRLAHDPQLDRAVSGMDAQLTRIRSRTLAGFRVVDANGVVIATSGRGLGQDLSSSPEVALALKGESAIHGKRRARATEYTPGGPGRGALVRLFAATPVIINGQVVGAVIVNRTPREELQALYQMTPRLWLGMLLAIVVTMGLGLVAGYLFSRNLVRMARTSHRIADGSIAGTALMQRPSRSHVRETRDLASAVSEMADRLQARVGYIREFAGNVSHEFKTPLSTLKGTVELLADDADMPAEQRARFLQNASVEVDRMSRLVAGLLALARAEERVDHGPIDLDAVIAAVAARHPDVHVAGSVGQFVGDAQQL
ncbi:MAG: signal transduction histidine kinase, partial [Kiritimatiellia bacterium]